MTEISSFNYWIKNVQYITHNAVMPFTNLLASLMYPLIRENVLGLLTLLPYGLIEFCLIHNIEEEPLFQKGNPTFDFWVLLVIIYNFHVTVSITEYEKFQWGPFYIWINLYLQDLENTIQEFRISCTNSSWIMQFLSSVCKSM